MIKRGLIIADAGPIFSLAIINKLDLLDRLFNEIKIPNAVWEEITLDKSTECFPLIHSFFKGKVVNIQGFNDLSFVMDHGESEAVILYQELKASFLLIDDKKARLIAENYGINCVGTLGLLLRAKNESLISDLKPFFSTLLENDRYYSVDLLNSLLERNNESKLEQ